VIAGAVELLDTDSGFISIVEPDGACRVRAAHNLPEAIVGTTIEPAAGRTDVAVPVWEHNTMIGVFGVLARDGSRVFDHEDREIMELLASHVAIALDNARLYG